MPVDCCKSRPEPSAKRVSIPTWVLDRPRPFQPTPDINLFQANRFADLAATESRRELAHDEVGKSGNDGTSGGRRAAKQIEMVVITLEIGAGDHLYDWAPP
jgi:hypothetical protein